MDKGRKILFSLGSGLVLLSILDFKLPIYISVGITVFVTILTFHDFINAGKNEDDFPFTNEKNTRTRVVESSLKVMILGIKFYKKLSEVALFFSIPISILVAYMAYDFMEQVDLDRLQQTLNLYTLGLVISILAFSQKTNTT